MKTKTYVITLSRTFPKGHPREGEDTLFKEKVITAFTPEMHPVFYPVKRHTIRVNYDLWKHRVDEVNAGRAVLSVREWLGKPRRSKQREILRLDRDSGIGVEMLRLNWWNVLDDDPERHKWHWVGNGMGALHGVEDFTGVSDTDLATNDGLTLDDWLAWFRDYDKSRPMAIIHFTKFRYCK